MKEISPKKNWRLFEINSESHIKDIQQGYLAKHQRNFLLTDLLETKLFSHFITNIYKINDDIVVNCYELNKYFTYKEQFFQGHASQGGRIIEVTTHLINKKQDLQKFNLNLNKGFNYYKGRLIHFDRPINGRYLWVITEDLDFIIANRQSFHHEMENMNFDLIDYRHRLHKLPHSTVAIGKQVYGAGEILVEGGLLKEFNSASGHYVDLQITDVFNNQCKKVFEYFVKIHSWHEVKEGMKFILKI